MHSLIKLFRIHDWWDYILPSSAAVFLLAYLYHHPHTPYSSDYVWFLLGIQLITIVFVASFGYYLNDLTDIQADLKSGKYNATAELSPGKRILVLSILTILCFVPAFFHRSVVIFIVLEMALLCAYSLPYIRMKENKYGAIIIDALCSGTILYVMSWSWFRISPAIDFPLILVVVWSFLKGLRNITYHLLADAENDRVADIKTFGNTTNHPLVRSIFSGILLPAEILLILTLILLCDPNTWFLVAISIACIIYLFLRDKYIVPFIWKRKTPILIDRMLVVNVFYEIFFPIILIVYCGWIIDPRIWWLLPVFFFLFGKMRLFFLNFLNK